MPRNDEMMFEILEDGTIRTTTNAVSAANHSSADEILKLVAKLAGGDVEIKKRPRAHTHTHEHKHERS